MGLGAKTKGPEYGIKEIKVYHHPDGGTTTVIRPDLPEDEYQRRHKALERAAAELLRCAYRNRQGKGVQ